MRRVFRPEFINRLDSVIIFHALTRENIRQIVTLELNKVATRLQDSTIQLKATPEATEKLAQEGYDPDMGARPLKRVIQQKVEDILSDAMLAGEFHSNDVILVDLVDGEIKLRRVEGQVTSSEPEAALPV